MNGAKLYLYGLLALKQRDTALFAEIKNVRKAHGCYDSHMAHISKGIRRRLSSADAGKARH